MNDLEQLLAEAYPGVPDAALRGRVLAAVSQELTARRVVWKPALALAASLLMALGLNMWVFRMDKERQSRLLDAGPDRRIVELAEMIESVANAGTRDFVVQRLESAQRHGSQQVWIEQQRQFAQLAEELNLAGKSR